MKKYITLFSLIGLFFIGIQNTQAQELQKRSLDESQGKDKREQITKMKKEKSLEVASEKSKEQLEQLKEVTELTPDQEKAAGIIFRDYHVQIIEMGELTKSDKIENYKVMLSDEADEKLSEVLSEEQFLAYKANQEKLTKKE